MDHYQPGLHLIGDIDTVEKDGLCDFSSCKKYIDELITQHELTKVGEIYHGFDGAGFTATVCLTESHIAVHTWPEYGKVTFDVFLSNFRRNNDVKGEAIFDALSLYFKAQKTDRKIIRR